MIVSAGLDAVVTGLRPAPHVRRAENLRVKRRFRRAVRQGQQSNNDSASLDDLISGV